MKKLIAFHRIVVYCFSFKDCSGEYSKSQFMCRVEISLYILLILIERMVHPQKSYSGN